MSGSSDAILGTARQLGHEAEAHRARARAFRDAAHDLTSLARDFDREAADAEQRAERIEAEKRDRQHLLMAQRGREVMQTGMYGGRHHAPPAATDESDHDEHMRGLE